MVSFAPSGLLSSRALDPRLAPWAIFFSPLRGSLLRALPALQGFPALQALPALRPFLLYARSCTNPSRTLRLFALRAVPALRAFPALRTFPALRAYLLLPLLPFLCPKRPV